MLNSVPQNFIRKNVWSALWFTPKILYVVTINWVIVPIIALKFALESKHLFLYEEGEKKKLFAKFCFWNFLPWKSENVCFYMEIFLYHPIYWYKFQSCRTNFWIFGHLKHQIWVFLARFILYENKIVSCQRHAACLNDSIAHIASYVEYCVFENMKCH